MRTLKVNVVQAAARQLHDYDARTPGTMFAEIGPADLSEAQAYAIQSQVRRLREQRGESLIGYKVGCTSPGIRAQIGIDHPVFGRLYDRDRWPTGATLPSGRFSELAIEGELAVRLAADLPGAGVSDAAFFDAIGSVFAVIELHNQVIRWRAPTAVEFIANNAIHAGFVYTTQPASELGSDPATLGIYVDDQQVAAVSGSESGSESGFELTRTVVESLRWLAGELEHHGEGLRRGQIVLCGSVAPLIPLGSGRRVAVTTDRFGSVECTIEQSEEHSNRK